MLANSQFNFIEKVTKLKTLLFQFDLSAQEEKTQLLSDLITYNNFTKNTFLQFHQLLIAMMAYPSNKVILKTTNETMSKLLMTLNNNTSLAGKLTGTGLFHTFIECNFSFSKVNYITQYFPNQVSIHSASSSIETQKYILKLILPSVEYSKIHGGEKDIKTRIKAFHISKTTTDLEWLIQTILQSSLDYNTQAFLYNQLGIFIQWNVSSEVDSVSFLKGTSQPIYFHTHLLDKKTNLPDIISHQLPTPVKLSLQEKHQLIHSAKMTLFYLYRETEPFTNSNINDITLFQLNKGISIALFGSTIDKRYSLESYVGYLVLKNNIPVSYGGGWIFGQRCQFGINILEAFRGGESSLIICELLRVYHQHYGATCFVVKPYQFGLHNSEAIKTGAFWFYYKLGFRPENKQLKELALQEEKQKTKNSNYKSTTSTLKQYTKSNLLLTLTNTSYPNYDCEILSQRITEFINNSFNNDRQKALKYCFDQLIETLKINQKFWKKEDIDYAKQAALLFYGHSVTKDWLRKNKKNIILLIQLKSASTELDWVKHLQNFDSFWELVKK